MAQVTQIGVCRRERLGADAGPKTVLMAMPEPNRNPLPERFTDEMCTYVIVRNKHCQAQGYLDLPLVLGRTRPAEVIVRQSMLCVRISDRMDLLLKLGESDPRECSRVGFLYSYTEAWDSNLATSRVVIT